MGYSILRVPYCADAVMTGALQAFTPGDPVVVYNNSPCALIETTHLSGTLPRGFTRDEQLAVLQSGQCGAAINIESLRRRPILVINASSDLGLRNDGEHFHAALQKCDIPVVYRVVEGTNHGSICWNNESWDMVSRFALSSTLPHPTDPTVPILLPATNDGTTDAISEVDTLAIHHALHAPDSTAPPAPLLSVI